MAKRHDKKQEAARRMREQRAKEKRQKQLRWGFGGVAAILVVGALIAGVMIVSKGYEVHQPKAASTKTALTLADEQKKPKVKLELYEDFMCPACGEFEAKNGESIREAVEAGQVELTFHPMNFLTNASSTDYSLRSASAATCAADEGRKQFFDYEKQLFAKQPPEGGEGLPDSELTKYGTDLGFGKDFKKCVKNNRYYGWVDQLTEAAFDEGVDSTPTVKLNGKKVKSEDFANAFGQAIKQEYPESGGNDKK